MKLHYKINKIEKTPIEVGIKDDIGIITIVSYSLYNNDKYIGDYSYNKESIPEKELLRNYIQYLIENKLNIIMDKIDLPEEVFFTEICEDDFYTGEKHDLRNKSLINHEETKQKGRELNGTYYFFLKQNIEKVEEVI